jgi:hypothetical protein
MLKRTLAVVLALVLMFPSQAFADTWDLPAVNNAFGNLVQEFLQRADASPARMVPLLIESLMRGTTNLHYDSEGRWNDVSYDYTLVSNAAEKEFFMQAEYASSYSWRTDFDLEVYLNDGNIGFTSSMLDSDIFGDYAYGVGLATIEEDILAFGALLGLDGRDMRSYMRYIRNMYDLLKAPRILEFNASHLTPYMMPFMQLILSADFSCETDAGGTRFGVKISSAEIAQFLRNIADVLEQDENMRNLLDREDWRGSSQYDRMIEGIRESAEELDSKDINLDISVFLYICENNRIVKAGFDYYYTDSGDIEDFKLNFCFGESADDTWTLETYSYSHMEPWWSDWRKAYLGGHTREDTTVITWELDKADGSYVNTFTMTEERPMNRWRQQSTGSLVFDWSPNTGMLAITSIYNDNEPDEIEVILRIDDNGSFFMRYEHRESWYEEPWHFLWNDMCEDCFYELEEVYYSADTFGNESFSSLYAVSANECRENCTGSQSELRELYTIFELSGVPDAVTVPRKPFKNVADLTPQFVKRAIAYFESHW